MCESLCSGGGNVHWKEARANTRVSTGQYGLVIFDPDFRCIGPYVFSITGPIRIFIEM